MIKIEMKVINSCSNDCLNNEIEETIRKWIPVGCHPIYIELWRENEFREYFTKATTMLHQPIGPDKLPEGFHTFSEYNEILTHQIALIINENWKITLMHEIIHVICSEMVGVVFWKQIRDIFDDTRRSIDPFEYVAIVLSNPKIIYDLKGEIMLNERRN
jgi:hypothetical protein